MTTSASSLRPRFGPTNAIRFICITSLPYSRKREQPKDRGDRSRAAHAPLTWGEAGSGLGSRCPRGPEGGGTSGTAGHLYAGFQGALKRRNVLSALAATKQLPQIGLVDSLELTVLVARRDPRRHPRVAARWLLRYLEKDPHAPIEEAALAASSLAALIGVAHEEAAQTLRAMAEKATRRRQAERVASI